MTARPITIGPSSNLAAVQYDPDTRTLTVDFLSGDTYEYDNVPESVANGFTGAASPGQYFFRYVRDKFPYTRF